MGNQNNMGEQIRDAVQQAVNSQDFSKLNETVSKSIGIAVDNIGKGIQQATEKAKQNQTQYQNNYQHQRNNRKPQVNQRQGRKTFNEQWINEPYQQKVREQNNQIMTGRYAAVRSAKTTGYLLAIVGGVLTSSFGVATLVYMITVMVTGGGGLSGNIILLLAFLAGSAILMGKGVAMVGNISTFQRYIRIIDKREYCDVKELADKTGKRESFVKKKLRQMIQRRLFLHGHMDKKESCLMVTEEAWQQYLTAENQLAERRKQEQIIEKQRKVKTEEKTHSQEVQAVLDEGNAYIARIHQSNEAIPGEAISAKISHMEMIVRKIFQRAQEQPAVIPDLKKLMEYYLPTTVKLLDAYEQLDGQPIQGENIASSKKEIEETLDTLNIAFEKLLDSVFKDIAWDVSTDISVLHTILAQEGLTEDVFKKEKEN